MPATILRPFYLTIKNRLTCPKSAEYNRKRDSILLLMTSIIILCIYFVATVILGTAKSNDLYLAILPTKLVELTFYLFFLTLIFSNTVAVIGSVYSASNMDLLLTLPISSFRLYLAKVGEILFESSSMLLMFSIPVSLAFSNTLDLPYTFLFVVLAASIPMIIAPIGISVLFGTLFVRFASMFWKRGTFLAIVAMAVGAWMISSIFNSLSGVEIGQGGQAMMSLIALFDNPNPIWLPSRWSSDLVAGMLGAPVENASTLWALLLSTAIGSLALGYLIFDSSVLETRSAAFSDSSGEYQEGEDIQPKSDFVRKGLEMLFNFFPVSQQNRSIILKDLSSLIRDRSQSLQLLLFVAISSVYLVIFRFMCLSMEMGEVAGQLWKAALGSFNILFTGFLLTAIMTRLIFPSVSLEGKSFWILQSSPIDLTGLLVSKFYCWFPFALFISLFLLLTGGWAVGMGWTELLNTAFTGACMAFGCTGLAIGMGAYFSSFDWESPNQLSTGLGTLALFGASLLLVVLVTIPAATSTLILAVPALANKYGVNFTIGVAATCQIFILFASIYASRLAKARGAIALQHKTLK